MAGWGVGAQGSQLGEMNPKMLMMLLNSRMEKQQEAAAQQKALMEKNRMLSMLAPGEANDARLFGMDYVAKNRQRDQAQQFDEMQRGRTAAEQDARLRAQMGVNRQSEEEKARQKQMMLEGIMRGVKQMPGFGPWGNADTGKVGANQMGPSQARMGVGGVKTQMAQNIPPPPVNVIDEWEEKTLKQNNIPVPPQIMTMSVYKDQRAQAQQAEAKAKQDADKAAGKTEEQEARSKGAMLAANLLGGSRTPNEELRFITALSDPKAKPWQVADKIIKDRESKAGKVEAKIEKTTTTEESNRLKLVDLPAEYNAAVDATKATDLGVEAKPAAFEKVVYISLPNRPDGRLRGVVDVSPVDASKRVDGFRR